ncbi:hypothetical protein CONLIGDRAFT_156815 [Coniochaeta ligniaria NRRL 30616]|uniref:C2H2-type domain-containing protein n=1 Tax=Coniochaeta ligniaria NRRL 30616 TaxID=1408157 RepID=A0A1J7JSI6_9PEZI|nr:hypothetical protein CONLIGDRAFT_156815 [Coniochaeta ligniaria NRRL 30616]
MRYLQSHPQIEDTIQCRPSRYRLPGPRNMRDIYGFRDKPGLQLLRHSWTSSSSKWPKDGLFLQSLHGLEALVDTSEHSALATATDQYGKLSKFKITGGILSEVPSWENNKRTDGPPARPEAYAVALKTFKQSDRHRFKLEADAFMSVNSTGGKPWAKLIQSDVLELDVVTGTNLEQDTNSHRPSDSPCSSDHQNDRGRKRSTSRGADGLSKAGKKHGGEGGDDQRDDRHGDNHPGATKKQKRSENQRRMACPYFKRNPVKYNRSVCCGPGFLGLHRVKEHVYRKHSTPDHCCPRCRSTFKTEAQLNDHMRSETPCDIVSKMEEEEECNPEQQRLLRARTNTTTLTDEERWRTMYTILFPNTTTVPSPYYDDGPAQEKIHAQDAEKYADHLRRELPSQLRQELEDHVQREFGAIEEVMRDQLANIVRNVTQRILETWRDSTTKSAPADSTEVASGTESSRGSTLGGQFDTVPRSMSNEALLSSPAASNICVEEERANPHNKSQSVEHNFSFADFDEFDSLPNDELESLLKRESRYSLEGYSCPDYSVALPDYGPELDRLAYGEPTWSLDQALPSWDTVYRTTNNSTTQDNSSEQKAI